MTPVEIRRRIDRLLARRSRRDDYGELLANGHVVTGPDGEAPRETPLSVVWRLPCLAPSRLE